jgi:glyoxylase-like metal-dependent hydrolase (beta-lactamase superfamily II)
MRIIPVKGCQNVYTSNVFLVLGDWKRIEDMNTLIDVGNDPSVMAAIDAIDTGVGKNKVEQIVLTHSHSDHTGILPLIKKRFQPQVYAFSPFIDGVDRILQDGDKIRIGESEFEVLHMPCHTNDSICLLNEAAGVVFSGDTPIPIRTPDGAYGDDFYQALKMLCQKKIHVIYPGHGEALTTNVADILCESLKNVRESRDRL